MQLKSLLKMYNCYGYNEYNEYKMNIMKQLLNIYKVKVW